MRKNSGWHIKIFSLMFVMYRLSIGCVFRNESGSIVEWIEHYLLHGVEHFYLIDDGSDDGSCDLLLPYLKRGLITLFKGGWGRYLGRQRAMYNEYILPVVQRKESAWLIMCDMDEYVWSPRNVDLRKLLNELTHIGQIQFEHTLFGSSGHEAQPASIVGGFTRRCAQMPTNNPGNLKYIVNCEYNFNSLNIHHATFVDKEDEDKRFLLLNDHFRMNHYSCQSQEFWNNVKCVRGDGDFWRNRTPEDFAAIDLNDVYDDTLLKQNQPVFEKLGLVVD